MAPVMTFWDHVSATLIGTISGFVFSIALFYITEAVKRRHERSKVSQSLRREFEYNINLLSAWDSELARAVAQITAGEKPVFLVLPYSSYSQLFTQLAFRQGILFETLDNEETASLDEILRFFTLGAEQFIQGRISSFNAGSLLPKEVFATLQFNRDMISKHKKTLSKFAQKYSPKKSTA